MTHKATGRHIQTPYLSPLEFADIHGVTERTVRRWIANGTLPAYRIGKRRIGIKLEDSEAFAAPIPAGDKAAG